MLVVVVFVGAMGMLVIVAPKIAVFVVDMLATAMLSAMVVPPAFSAVVIVPAMVGIGRHMDVAAISGVTMSKFPIPAIDAFRIAVIMSRDREAIAIVAPIGMSVVRRGRAHLQRQGDKRDADGAENSFRDQGFHVAVSVFALASCAERAVVR